MDGEAAVVGDEVDAEGALSGALDEDGDVGGEGGGRVVVVGFLYIQVIVSMDVSFGG